MVGSPRWPIAAKVSEAPRKPVATKVFEAPKRPIGDKARERCLKLTMSRTEHFYG